MSEKFTGFALATVLRGSAGLGKLIGSIDGEIWKSLSGKVSEDAVFAVFAYDRAEAA